MIIMVMIHMTIFIIKKDYFNGIEYPNLINIELKL